MSMKRRTRLPSEDRELLEAIQTQYRLREALKVLFELLERYSPIWYEKRLHDQAKSALNLPVARKRVNE